MSGHPYCSHCGYTLTGLTDSARCPECGQPLVEILTRGPRPAARGYRFVSERRWFGLPLLHIAFGPSGTERRGWARGIVAIGDLAYGVVAVGPIACGILGFGAIGVGLLGVGGLGVGLLALGGGAVGGLAFGGLSVGVLAVGGLSIGWVAQGGLAIGYFAQGGAAIGPYGVSGTRQDPAAIALFERLRWLLGQTGRGGLLSAAMRAINATLYTAFALCILIWLGNRFARRRQLPPE